MLIMFYLKLFSYAKNIQLKKKNLPQQFPLERSSYNLIALCIISNLHKLYQENWTNVTIVVLFNIFNGFSYLSDVWAS